MRSPRAKVYGTLIARQNPDRFCAFVFHLKFTNKITTGYHEKIQEYVRLLIGAGADLICILGPGAVMLGPDQFQEFSAKYVKHINQSCQHTDTATIHHTCGNTMHLIEKMVESGVDGLSLDSADAGVDMVAIAEMVPEEISSLSVQFTLAYCACIFRTSKQHHLNYNYEQRKTSRLSADKLSKVVQVFMPKLTGYS